MGWRSWFYIISLILVCYMKVKPIFKHGLGEIRWKDKYYWLDWACCIIIPQILVLYILAVFVFNIEESKEAIKKLLS